MGKRMPIDYVSDPPELPTSTLDEKPYDIRYATHVLSEDEPDMVNHPSHYTQGGIECIEAIRASMMPEAFQGYCKGNVMKYIWRASLKNGVEDLKKAAVYLGWMIESMEGSK